MSAEQSASLQGGMHMLSRVAVAIIALGLLASPGAAQNTTWKYTSWTPPSSINNVYGTIPMFESIEKITGKKFIVQNFMGAQLFNNRTTLKGVADGVADAGVVVPAFTPQELKHAAIITDAVALFTDDWASTPAANEALFTVCPECMKDFHDNNTISLGVYGGTQLRTQCVVDVPDVAALKGLKVAGVSSMTARWAERIGQVRQQIGPGDLLPALQRRQVDCTMSPLEFMFTLSLQDVVKTVVDHPLGAFPAIHLMTVNRKSWQALSPAYKKLILEEMPKAIARSTGAYANGDAKARKVAAEKGIKIVTFPELDAIWTDFVKTEKEKTVIELAAARGISAEVTTKVLNAHLSLLPKWKKIMDERGRNEEALAKAMWDEIFSKLDPDKL
jgi:TRAP-type C4-dicarboxylate transport system substrate-binding protein